MVCVHDFYRNFRISWFVTFWVRDFPQGSFSESQHNGICLGLWHITITTSVVVFPVLCDCPKLIVLNWLLLYGITELLFSALFWFSFCCLAYYTRMAINVENLEYSANSLSLENSRNYWNSVDKVAKKKKQTKTNKAQHPEDMCLQYNAVWLWNMDSYKTLRKPNPVLWEKMLPEDSEDRMDTKGH